MKYVIYILLIAIIPILFLIALKFIPKPSYDVKYKTIERQVDKVKPLVIPEKYNNCEKC